MNFMLPTFVQNDIILLMIKRVKSFLMENIIEWPNLEKREMSDYHGVKGVIVLASI